MLINELEVAQLEKPIKELPTWVYYDDKGALKVSASKLGYIIIQEIPMIRASDLSYGARFDKRLGAWRLDSLSDFLDGYITKKLESVGKWSQQKLNEVKKFIFIKIYNSQLKHSPFNDSKPWLANFKNGTYNIKTDSLKLHDIKDYILQSQEYTINPTNDKQSIKTISWLVDLTGDKDSAKYLMEIIGYCFYRSYAPFQAITILQGKGENGKSTFLNILTKVLGESNVSNVTLQDLGNKQNRFASSNLYQKLANLFADIDADFIKSTGMLKALTGGDRISAEQKGKDAFMFINFAKLIFSANNLPPFNDFTAGFERRLYVVPFNEVIDDDFKNRHSLKEIEAEIPIFAVECMRAFNEALNRGNLTVSVKMKQAKEQWIKDSNHIIRFIEEMCNLDMESNTGDSSRKIYEEYRNYCFRESLKEFSQPKFTKQLESMGIYKKNPRAEGQRMQRYIHLFLKSKLTVE